TIRGEHIRPEERNQHPFHFRHFTSSDNGRTWSDQGSVMSPAQNKQSFYHRNIWSSSIKPISKTQKLVSFTGIRQQDPQHQFLQAIGVAVTKDGQNISALQEQALSCPQRDYESITKAGYYLGPKEQLGANKGEDDGPILAWRDPFIFVDDNDEIQLFWSAKIAAREAAIAHATLQQNDTGFAIKTLHPPMLLPDGHNITQAEIPKIHHDKKTGKYYLLVSACDRLYENQPEQQVSKTLRLYTAQSIRGPWQSYKEQGSTLPGLAHCFGASILSADFDKPELYLICPRTEMAPPALQLTFAPVQTVCISQ
ncbi:hypothetical protein MNBD_ALPHA06-1910, partial [hydrothermal vent metagenome]